MINFNLSFDSPKEIDFNAICIEKYKGKKNDRIRC